MSHLCRSGPLDRLGCSPLSRLRAASGIVTINLTELCIHLEPVRCLQLGLLMEMLFPCQVIR